MLQFQRTAINVCCYWVDDSSPVWSYVKLVICTNVKFHFVMNSSHHVSARLAQWSFKFWQILNCLPLKDGVTFYSFKQTWIDPVLLEKIKQYYKLSTNASNCILHIRVNHIILCDNVRVALAQLKRSTMVDNSDFKMSIFIWVKKIRI